MRKVYFVIALIVLCFEGNSQIIVIPDANFKMVRYYGIHARRAKKE